MVARERLRGSGAAGSGGIRQRGQDKRKGAVRSSANSGGRRVQGQGATQCGEAPAAAATHNSYVFELRSSLPQRHGVLALTQQSRRSAAGLDSWHAADGRAPALRVQVVGGGRASRRWRSTAGVARVWGASRPPPALRVQVVGGSRASRRWRSTAGVARLWGAGRPPPALRVQVVGGHQQLQRHLGRHPELGDVLGGGVGVAQLRDGRAWRVQAARARRAQQRRRKRACAAAGGGHDGR